VRDGFLRGAHHQKRTGARMCSCSFLVTRTGIRPSLRYGGGAYSASLRSTNRVRALASREQAPVGFRRTLEPLRAPKE